MRLRQASTISYFISSIIFILLFQSIAHGYFGNKSVVVKAKWKGRDVKYIDGEIAIKFKNQIDEIELQRILESLHGKVQERYDELRSVVVDIPDKSDLIGLLGTVEAFPSVEMAVPRLLGKAMEAPTEIVPNDTYFYPEQWYMRSFG